MCNVSTDANPSVALRGWAVFLGILLWHFIACVLRDIIASLEAEHVFLLLRIC